MANINIKIEKKDLWLLSAIMIFLIGVGYVVAYNSGAAPNVMGHSFGELEGVQARVTGVCAAGSSIRNISATGTVTCEADSGFTTCTTLTFSSGGVNPSLLCNAGWTMTSGGCHCIGTSPILTISEPSGNGWFCACSAAESQTEISVRCCQ